MKNLGSILIAVTILNVAPLQMQAIGSKDTVTVEFGNRSKLVIIAETQKDFETLKEYDINQMIDNLNMNLDTAGEGINDLTILDESGERYLKDTTKEKSGASGRSHEIEYYDEQDNYVRNKAESWKDDFKEFDKNEYNHREKRTQGSFQIELGVNNWLEDGAFPDTDGKPYAVKPWGSWYFGLGVNQRTHVAGPIVLNWGGGISVYDWKMENTSMRIIQDEEGVVFAEDNSVDGIKSKLSATYINATVVPMLDFGYSKKKYPRKYGTFNKYKRRGFRIGLGAYAGYRIKSKTKFVYKEDGDKEKDKTNGNYYLNSFRYGIRGELGLKGMDFFVNYDMNEVFGTDRGPKLNAVSFGVIL